MISVFGPPALNILFKLHKQGLTTIGVSTSVENDVAATCPLSGRNNLVDD